jgi:hypothetical protein
MRHLDYDDLVYGNDRLSTLVEKFPEVKDGLTRFLYEIILRRMEIRDKSRSVNSIDVVFNFDCIGFTGTPFIDNYPTFAYIRNQREDDIPSLIDRSFYAYTSENLSAVDFEARFESFQAQNNHVLVNYVPSDFVEDATDELAILKQLFVAENEKGMAGMTPRMAEVELCDGGSSSSSSGVVAPPATVQEGFNVLVDLCGIFKKTTIHEVRLTYISLRMECLVLKFPTACMFWTRNILID